LQAISISDIYHAKYCDDFSKNKKAIHDNAPYDLLISDLSFKADHRENKLVSGEELIEAVKKYNLISKLSFSIEDKSFRIKSLLILYKSMLTYQKER
jgi:uncharacterized protein YktB (UPF0637 family)